MEQTTRQPIASELPRAYVARRARGPTPTRRRMDGAGESREIADLDDAAEHCGAPFDTLRTRAPSDLHYRPPRPMRKLNPPRHEPARTMKTSERQNLLETLERRFERNMPRHEGIAWAEVRARLEPDAKALKSIHAMEETGGEPDVIGRNATTGVVTLCDCSAESPARRRSLCYDREALASRKEHKPKGSAVETAASMGIALLTEADYRSLQLLGAFDTKTSSWIATPADVRALGGALFCDRRYGKVFVYHNGAESYYAARGFRGLLRV